MRIVRTQLVIRGNILCVSANFRWWFENVSAYRQILGGGLRTVSAYRQKNVSGCSNTVWFEILPGGSETMSKKDNRKEAANWEERQGKLFFVGVKGIIYTHKGFGVRVCGVVVRAL